MNKRQHAFSKWLRLTSKWKGTKSTQLCEFSPKPHARPWWRCSRGRKGKSVELNPAQQRHSILQNRKMAQITDKKITRTLCEVKQISHRAIWVAIKLSTKTHIRLLFKKQLKLSRWMITVGCCILLVHGLASTLEMKIALVAFAKLFHRLSHFAGLRAYNDVFHALLRKRRKTSCSERALVNHRLQVFESLISVEV